jgi:coenzyme F420-0:L-glutamate ligase / coenzyme F420-1:gamma-L-glutamate ligase
MDAVTLIPLLGFPRVEPGDSLDEQILAAAGQTGFADGDIVVLAQKVVSKSEGRYVQLQDVVPSHEAARLAAIARKDPRIVELILSESSEVLRAVPGVIIVRHKLGYVMANAGMDRSNLAERGAEQVLLLPADPDRSAAELRRKLQAATRRKLAVLIIDSFGRPWRNGTCGTAIGSSGIQALRDLRGRTDFYGRRLETSELGFADEIAAAASLVMGQADEGRPVVMVRGVQWDESDQCAANLVRPIASDLFK